VFENRVLRRIRVFGPKRDEVTGVRRNWREMHNEELNNLYSSPSKIIMNKSRKMRLTGHVEQNGEKRNSYRILGGSQKKKDH
jgi:hypothetical protein